MFIDLLHNLATEHTNNDQLSYMLQYKSCTPKPYSNHMMHEMNNEIY